MPDIRGPRVAFRLVLLLLTVACAEQSFGQEPGDEPGTGGEPGPVADRAESRTQSFQTSCNFLSLPFHRARPPIWVKQTAFAFTKHQPYRDVLRQRDSDRTHFQLRQT